MSKTGDAAKRTKVGPGSGLGVIALAVAVLGATVAGLAWGLRGELRELVLAREAESIAAVLAMRQEAAEESVRALGVEPGMEEVFVALLETSRLRGVLAVQLYDDAQELVAALPETAFGTAAPGTWTREGPRAEWLDGRVWEELWDEPLAEGVSAALLVVTAPVATGETLGWARLWVEGRAVAAEFAALDRGLARQAGVVAGLGGLGLGGGLAWVWVTLARARERLRAQQADLTRANRALMFSAQASAVGALSAHLLHGIKNPLAGLEGFLAEGEGTAGGEAWREASATARRLRAMVGEVMAVMRECEDDVGARRTVAEVFDGVAQRAAGGAGGGVRVAASAADVIELGGREAGLAGLVLDNLATNAREAAVPGGRVELRAVAGSAGGVNLLVVDDGLGLPEAVRRGLFRPLASTKPGGAGLGLALSAELARAAGGELRLVRSDESGTEWSLRVPAVVA